MLQHISRDKRLVHALIFVIFEGHEGIVGQRILHRYRRQINQLLLRKYLRSKLSNSPWTLLNNPGILSDSSQLISKAKSWRRRVQGVSVSDPSVHRMQR